MGEMGNRPDCAYFLLLGLCGAAFLLTIGGILTYIAFNPGSMDNHPHSALSHIPHFHHYKHHSVGSINNNHHHYQPHDSVSPHQQNTAHQTHHQPQQEHLGHRNPDLDSHQHNSESESHKNHTNLPMNTTRHHPDHVNNEKLLAETSRKKNTSDDSPRGHPAARNSSLVHEHVRQKSPDSGGPGSMESYEAKAKQSLALAIIGPLCLLMGIVVTLIVGVLALRYDCDHEPEPNIAFLRLRSEMSLNFDSDKNNYELLRPSSSIDQAGGQFSINPTGLRC